MKKSSKRLKRARRDSSRKRSSSRSCSERIKNSQAFSYLGFARPARAASQHRRSSALLEEHGDKLDENRQSYYESACRDTADGELIDDLLQVPRSAAPNRNGSRWISALADVVAAGLQQAAPERHVRIAIEDGNAATPCLLQGCCWRTCLETRVAASDVNIAEARIEVGMTRQEDVVQYYVRDDWV